MCKIRYKWIDRDQIVQHLTLRRTLEASFSRDVPVIPNTFSIPFTSPPLPPLSSARKNPLTDDEIEAFSPKASFGFEELSDSISTWVDLHGA